MLSNYNLDLNNVEILEGSTSSYLMLIDNKVVYHKNHSDVIQKLVNFYQIYQEIEYFPRLIRYEPDFSSLLLDYIPGNYHIKTVNQDTYAYIKNVVDSYIPVVDSGVAWRSFIKARKDICLEIYQLHSLDIFPGPVREAYYMIKDDIKQLYLTHGDLGSHNFITLDGEIKGVIGAEPLIANKLYDYYFAINSSKDLLINYDVNRIESAIEEAYFIFNLFASISKMLFHHPEDRDFYLNYFYDYEPKFLKEVNNV